MKHEVVPRGRCSAETGGKRVLVLAAACLILGGACKKKEAPPAPVVTPAAVPAPEGRIADIIVPTPNAFWSHVQRGVGGALGIMPPTLGGVVCAMAGLDVAMGSEIDGAAPAYGVVVADQGGSTSYAFAVRLVDPTRAKDRLALGADAPFSARPSGALTVLVPKSNPTPLMLALAPNGYLLLAKTEDALTRLGPYTYLTLPTRTAPPNGIVIETPHDALAGVLHDQLARAWDEVKRGALQQDTSMRAQHGGRAPDFGDAAAIVASADSTIQGILAFEADLDLARLTLDADDAALHAALALVPSAGGGAATQTLAKMHPGDTTPLAKLADTTSLALLWRDDPATHEQDGAALADALAHAFGDRLPPEDATTLRKAVSDWEAARGEWLTMTVSPASSLEVGLHTPVVDAPKGARAVHELIELGKMPAFAGPLKTLLDVHGQTLTTVQVAGFENAEVATLLRGTSADTKATAAPRSKLGLAWGTASGQLHVAGASNAPGALASAVAPDKTLGTLPSVAAALHALGDEASFALVAQPLPGASPGADAPAVVLGWGRHEGHGWARIDASDLLLRDLVRWQTGF